MNSATIPTDPIESAQTQTGESLGALSRKSPVLVVFLRHCGCTFARQALGDVAARRAAITAAGTNIVVVHMHTAAAADTLFAKYGLADVLRISDPQQTFYQAFELHRGTLWQVAGPVNWWRALTSVLSGHLAGIPTADVFQLPGAFLIHNGQIVNAFRGKNSSDKPNYSDLATCPRESSR